MGSTDPTERPISSTEPSAKQPEPGPAVPDRGPRWQPSLPGIALLAAPGSLLLLGLGVFGALDLELALLCIALLVSVSAILVGRHLAAVERLRRRVEAYGHGGAEAMSGPPRSGDTVLLPGLEAALNEAAEERLQARKALETAIGSNEAVLTTLPDPLIMLDGRRRIVRLNAAASTLFGRRSTGHDLTDVLRAPALLEGVDEILAGASSRVVDFTIPGPVQRTYSARIARLPAETSDSTVAIITLHDLTSIKRAEQLRADFVANASHELRTPLSSLLGFIETLRGPAREDEEARSRFLRIMHDQALRMTRLVEDLLSLSRIEMNEHSAPTGVADLTKVLRSVASTLELPAREKSMAIRLDIAGLTPVVGDSDDLTQVFQNLIDNAIKYGREGTDVRVSGSDPTEASSKLGVEAVGVSVTNLGEGIPREHLPRLTERFYRVDKARSRQLGGTGLGLAIVKHIVNRHRGALDVTSVEGEHSTFTVVLPAAEAVQEDAAAE